MSNHDIEPIRRYWDTHPLGQQYVRDASLPTGSREFFAHIRPWMGPYKFPWIMPRIEREAARLKDRHLLEIGCGMGFDSVEFMRRGVRVTASDLTPTAVELARRHFELEGLKPEDVRVENARALSFPDATFDAVWSRGVIHHCGDPGRAIREIHRVLKPGGRAIICHFYRRNSWMYWMSRLSRENIEFKEEDPPANDFLSDQEIMALFDGFAIEEVAREHYRALPIARQGLKAALYTWGFRPTYNLMPRPLAERLAYKTSITAVKKPDPRQGAEPRP